MFRKVETIDFKTFMKKEEPLNNNNRKFKKVITVGAVSLVIISSIPIPPEIVQAATETITTESSTWDKLVGGLIKLLDPVARIFGIIAGIAIMTGNGKIGLERLFWLSIGYLTARKVEDWIAFLNTL